MISDPLSRLTNDLSKAMPVLIPIYCALLAGLCAIPVMNEHADMARIAALREQIAFFTTVDLWLGWRILRSKLRLDVYY